MAPILRHDMLLELFSIDEIAIVREADAVRRIDIERLRFGDAEIDAFEKSNSSNRPWA